MAPLVWFVTGYSTGFGRELVHAALSRGDKVIATARNASKLELLKDAGADTMQLDVTATLDYLKKSAEKGAQAVRPYRCAGKQCRLCYGRDFGRAEVGPNFWVDTFSF
jgi:NAD(P)-dependent dehydrogenase (short-subunit alcohol dehydrogenase family)